MSLFPSFMRDFDDDGFFGKNMSRHKRNSISYTISPDDDSDEDDRSYGSVHANKSSQNRLPSMPGIMADYNSMIDSMFNRHTNMFLGGGRRGRQDQLMPFGFPNMSNIFDGFQINPNDPNCHSFSSSTFMTMSSGPDGRPQVYQASQSTRTAPGGIRETKKSVCDSRTGTKKMAIGHHIGDRAHVLEREQNLHSGQEEERQEFINLDEDEADEFNREWETKTRGTANAIGYGGHHRSHSRRPREDLPAIQDRYRPRARITPRRHYYPAITSSPSSEQTTERAKKRYHVEHVISSDEEEEVVVKKSNKGTKTSSAGSKTETGSGSSKKE